MFHRDVRGEQQGIYSVVFAAISAPFVGTWGLSGTFVLPLLGGLLALAAFRLLLGRYRCAERTKTAATLLLVCLTPLSFYSSQFAEHSLATGLCLLALAMLFPTPAARRAPIWAGLCVGLAATLRPEMYCGAASVGAAILSAPASTLRVRIRAAAWYATAGGAVMGAYWTINLALSGTWDPLVAHNHDANAGWTSARTLLVGDVGTGHGFLWLLPFAGAIALFWVPQSWRHLSRAIRAVAVVALVGSLCIAQSMATDRTAVGLFAATPIAAYGLLGDNGRGRLRPLWFFSVTFIVQVMVLDKSGTAGGLQFGARFLLPAVPVLIAVGAVSLGQDWRDSRRRAAVFSLLPASVLLMLTVHAVAHDLPRCVKIARDGETLVEQVEALPPKIVVTRRTWEAQVLLPVAEHGKRVYTASHDPAPLMTRIADAGHPSFVFVSVRDTSVFLPGRRVARSTLQQKGWLDVHLMEFQPRE